jgi:hypothetical protein
MYWDSGWQRCGCHDTSKYYNQLTKVCEVIPTTGDSDGSSYPEGSCGRHMWGKDQDGTEKCGELEPYNSDDTFLST